MKRPPRRSSLSRKRQQRHDSTAITPAAASSNDSDPNRPVLSHNKTAKPSNGREPRFCIRKSRSARFPPRGKGARAYPAISDAGQYEMRSLLYSMSPGERQMQEQQMLEAGHGRDPRIRRQAQWAGRFPKTAAITDYDVRAFDLELQQFAHDGADGEASHHRRQRSARHRLHLLRDHRCPRGHQRPGAEDLLVGDRQPPPRCLSPHGADRRRRCRRQWTRRPALPPVFRRRHHVMGCIASRPTRSKRSSRADRRCR